MKKKLSVAEYVGHSMMWVLEAAFITIAPIYLYGWIKGLLIASALSSLLHIAALLCGMLPSYDIEEAKKIIESKGE